MRAQTRRLNKRGAHPSDVMDYFRSKADLTEENLMDALEQNYMDKHEAVQRTARALD